MPLIFPICPTKLPTAPAAADTTKVSPAFGWHMSKRPWNAVFLKRYDKWMLSMSQMKFYPGIPMQPKAYESGSPFISGIFKIEL